MRKTRFRVLLVLVGIWCAFPVRGTAQGTMGLEQLTHTSSAVVRGRVMKQESRENADQTQMLTLTTVAVMETMKGSTPRELVVEQPGGKTGNTQGNVSGAFTLQIQTEYVLFLDLLPSKEEPLAYRVVSNAQGVYRVYRDAQTRVDYVVPSSRAVFGATAPGEAAAGRKARPPAIPLSQFRQQVERSLNQPIYIPRGMSFAVAIRSMESRGVGRMQVLGQTVSDVSPSVGAVIPAGSTIEGTAQRVGGKWLIRWTDLSVRDTHIEISGSSEEMTEGSLRGRTLVVKVK